MDQTVSLPHFKRRVKDKDGKAQEIDLKRVRDVRREIRRRYVRAKNYQKIFNRWDLDHTGRVSAQNMYDMCHKINIDITKEEARVLLASANKSRTGQLSPDEFLDLIFNDANILNLDVSQINFQVDDIKDFDQLKTAMHKDAAKARRHRHMNQLRLILKNKAGELGKNFLFADKEKKGIINFESFSAALEKLQLNKNIMTHRDIKELYDEFSTNASSQFHYKKFLGKLEDFVFDTNKIYEDMRLFNLRNSEKSSREKYKTYIDKLRHLDDMDDFKFYESKDMPANKVEEVFRKVLRIKRFLKNYFPTQKKFDDFLKGAVPLNKGQFKKTLISKQNFRSLMTSVFEKFEFKVPQRTIEKFVAFFNTNKKGNINLSEISKLVYKEDNNMFYERVQKRLNGPPPVYYTEDLDKIPQDKEEKRLKELMKDPEKKGEIKSKEEIFGILDNELFRASERQFDKFNKFDKDKDGYVSMNDLKQTLSCLNIIDDEDIDKLAEMVDSEKKGYLNFSEFSKKIHNNMINMDAKVRFL